MKDELRKSDRFVVVGSASNGEQCLKESEKNNMFINFNKYIELFESML